MKTLAFVATLLMSTSAINIDSILHSKTKGKMNNKVKSKNLRLEAWNEIYHNVNDVEYMQSQELALNEQILGQNLHIKDDGQEEQQMEIDPNSVADLLASKGTAKDQDMAIKQLYAIKPEVHSDDEGNTLMSSYHQHSDPTAEEQGLDEDHKSHLLIQSGVSDPTVGDLPSNVEQSDVVANVLGSHASEAAQAAMIANVTDEHAKNGATKAPAIPPAQVYAHDVENHPDPVHEDNDPAVDDAPDAQAPAAEVAASALAQKKRGFDSQQMLAEVNSEQRQFQNENSQFLAIKQRHSQEIVEKVSSMNKEMDEFSHTLDMRHYDSALALQQQLKKDGLRDHEKLMSVRTKDVFKKGFKMFPQVSQNEYVQEQLAYLEAAEDNLNGNLINPRLVQALVDRGHEVAGNFEQQYGEQWENPLKN